MTKLVIMLSSVDDKTENYATYISRWQKLIIMLSSVDDKTGYYATFISGWQNW